MCFRKVCHLWIILKNLLLILVIILIILNSRTIAPWLQRSRWSGSTRITCRWLDSFGSPSWGLSWSHEIVHLNSIRWRKPMAVLDALRLSVRLFHQFLGFSIAILNTNFLLTFLRTRGSRKIIRRNHLVLLVTNLFSGSSTFMSNSQDSSILIHFWILALENVVILLFLGLTLVEKVYFRRIIDCDLRGHWLGSARLSLNGVAEHLWSALTPHETHKWSGSIHTFEVF